MKVYAANTIAAKAATDKVIPLSFILLVKNETANYNF